MVRQLARTLKLSPTAFSAIAVVVLLVVALALGLALSRLFHRYAEKNRERNTWAEFVFSLLEALPIPLLLLAGLYTAIQFLPLPRRYERLGSQLISSLVILVIYLFPARVVVLFLSRVGARNAGRARLAQLLVAITRDAFVLLALYTLQENLTSLPRKYERFGANLAQTLGIILFFYALARLTALYLDRIREREPTLRRLTDPAILVARVIFGALAMIIILENLGVHLTAVWTTLGVGSVAVALALQETLSNLFAGLYLLADRPISPGDYIKLDSGHEGYVVRVGWRSTVIRTLANNAIIVPNSNMSKAVITNYSVPELRMSVSVGVSVAYGTDTARVEKALLAAAADAVADGLDGLLPHPAPSVAFIPGFGASSLDFSLGFNVRRFTDQYSVQSELRKRILDRFRKEGIEMPFPTRTIVLDHEALSAISGEKTTEATAHRNSGSGDERRSRVRDETVPAGKEAQEGSK
jgi:small-conductance mechanosensitive channel